MAKKRFTDDQRKQIDEIVAALKYHNFYTILGVEESATPVEIKRGYFSLSKTFHPDIFYGEKLGDYMFKLETVFRSLTRAYECLSNKAKREKYDVYLAQKKALRGIESHAATQMADVKARITESTGIVPVFSMDHAQVEADSGVQVGRKKFDSSILDKQASIHDKWKRRRMQSFLGKVIPKDGDKPVRREQPKAPPTPAPKVEDLMIKASQAEKAGNYQDAMNLLKVAISYDPENKELQDRFERVLKEVSPVLGRKHFAMGMSELEFGDEGAAVDSFRKAVQYCPDHAEYNFRLAEALLIAGRDVREAYNAARKAIGVDANDPLYFLLFGRICIKAGLEKTAATALTNCLKLDPKNREARELLDDIE
ncbi:MAG: DnaJ domain-containing protein [Pseudomonadota bacterium]